MNNFFPDTLELEPMENLKRKLVHNIASEFELRTQSHGVEPNRKITVMKSKFARNVILTDAQPLRLGDNQLASILDFLHDHPVNLADLDDHLKADISCGYIFNLLIIFNPLFRPRKQAKL
jgi:hypothetical protein